MPSPFPGMDPYLEGELWSNFHAQFAVEIAHQLNPLLAPRYVAVTEKYPNIVGPEHVVVATEAEPFAPDIGVAQASLKPMRASGAALLEPPSIPIDHVWVKILDARRRLLVAAIEFRSPTNKQGGGRTKYLKKRRRLLLSQVHLLEIDLLRKGKRVPMADPLPVAPYFVFLCRAGQRPGTGVWPIKMDERLPDIPVPLLEKDPDVALSLQRAFQSVYDQGSMEQLIDYSQAPDVPLSPDGAAWADQLLRQAGKR